MRKSADSVIKILQGRSSESETQEYKEHLKWLKKNKKYLTDEQKISFKLLNHYEGQH
jgi:hypothetical protein